jgi:hypothetical protein
VTSLDGDFTPKILSSNVSRLYRTSAVTFCKIRLFTACLENATIGGNSFLKTIRFDHMMRISIDYALSHEEVAIGAMAADEQKQCWESSHHKIRKLLLSIGRLQRGSHHEALPLGLPVGECKNHS